MKKIFTMFLFIILVGSNYGQSLLDSHGQVNLNQIQHRNVLNISGSIESNNYYISGNTMDLFFTLNAFTADEEYVDQVIMTFPDGIKPNSAVDPFPGRTSSQTKAEALNINGQVVTWGDNDNSFGGITTPGIYSFYINVTVDTNIVGDIEIQYSVSGDQYKGTIHQFNGTVSVKPLPETPELVTSLTGTISEYYQIPLEQATFAPSAKITNIGSDLVDTITLFAKSDNGYNDSTIIDNGILTNKSKEFEFSEFSASEKGDVNFTFNNNITNDANPNTKPLTKTIEVGTILSRDNGKIVSHIGIGSAGSELGQVFTISKQDTLTSMVFVLGQGAKIDNNISLKVRAFTNGKPGQELGSSLPFKIVEDTIYQIDIFPAVVLAPGSYYLGVVEGENNINLAVTSTPFIEHSAWGFFNNKWNDIGELGFSHTYYIRAVFDNYKEINNDIKLSSINMKDGYALGNIDIVGTIRNLSNVNKLTSFDVEYSVDNGNKVIFNVSGISVNPGETYSFKHGTVYDANITGAHDITINVSKPNGNDDENVDDNELSKGFMVVNEVYTKVVVGEEATGTWCGWCVRGHVGLKDMYHNHTTEEWIGIAVHNGDPMVNSEYDGKISAKVPGYPSGVINRDIIADPGAFEETFQLLKNEIPAAKVEISSATMEPSSREITVETATVGALDLDSTNYRLSMVVVEDGVEGTSSKYAQVNYYSSNGIIITDWEGIDWSKLGNPIPADKMVYNHVGRYLVGGWNGISGSVPVSIKYNVKNDYTFTTKLPAEYDEKNIRLVILLLNNDNGKVINASEIDLDITNSTVKVGNPNDVSIYPNPTTDFIKINAKKGYNVSIYNTNGQLVLKSEMTEDTKTIDLSNLDKGSYFVEIFNTKTVYSKKIVLIK